MVLEWDSFLKAFELIEEVEKNMGKTFSSIGKSIVAPEVDKIISIIQQHKRINEKQLLQMVWRDVDAIQFDGIMQTIIRGGYAKRGYDKQGVWYISID